MMSKPSITYGSVCSGIEAASVAWEPLGWRPVFFSEIDPFPRAVLAYRWPGVTCHGDFTTIGAGDYGPIDLLVGGTPCQSFSVAGLRGGLADERGNLALAYLRLADRKKPRWLLWENVPGVLSSGAGRDFGSFVGGLGELGYGFAYRVLDAQYFGLAQRRKRVFVVGYLGDWRVAAAVLFEPASLRGDSAPRREPRERVAPTISSRTTGGGGLGTDFDLDGGLIAGTLNTVPAKGGWRIGPDEATANHIIAFGGNNTAGPTAYRTSPNCGAWDTGGRIDALTSGTDRTSHVLAFHENQRGEVTTNDTAGSLKVGGGKPGQGYPAILGFQSSQSGVRQVETHATLDANNGSRRHNGAIVGSAVRRLTPRECCRLQGFPDDYLDIIYRGKPTADGPKYKALGNSMAVPVIRWIGQRIAAQDAAMGIVK